jgi:DNA-binding LacI/PurR family transcriptional regulator
MRQRENAPFLTAEIFEAAGTVATAEGYQALRRRLLDKLIGGGATPGSRFYSVREVAAWPGATAHLAQRALAELCREGYLESVPKKGLFVRGQGRRNGNGDTQNGAQLLLFLIPPGSNQPRVNEMPPVLGAALDPSRWRMEVVYMKADYDADGGLAFSQLLLSREPAGVLWLMPKPSDAMLIHHLTRNGLPLVTYNRDFSRAGAMAVVADVADVARHLFDSVWSEGRHRVACVSVDRPSPSIRQFADTVARCAAERGVGGTFRHLLLPYDDDNFLTDRVLREFDGFMAAEPRPDAIVCAESFSLLALEHWLVDHPGVRVPRDLAVASFDRQRTDPVVRVIPPILTADFDQLGMMTTAIEMLERAIAGRRSDTLVRKVPAVLLPPAERRRLSAPIAGE